MKRFWREASVGERNGGSTIQLDGRPLRLPGGAPLRVDGRALAEAIAAEWQAAGGAVGGEMSYEDVPLTRLAGTAQERIAPDPEGTIDGLARYGESELLCYRATGPDALVHRQRTQWQPWLDWAARSLDANLLVTAGVMPVVQDKQALKALRSAVAAYDAYGLAGLGLAVPALGSLVLGLALGQGRLDAAAAQALATLDERFQAELWGEDAEAAARQRRIGEEVALADRFMTLSRAGR
ncbi:MAG TPA: ATP12 family protein [Acetobacteraceae bacterium]|nr:ATP12 family protein [Acetobacteraceae bacterium]